MQASQQKAIAEAKLEAEIAKAVSDSWQAKGRNVYRTLSIGSILVDFTATIGMAIAYPFARLFGYNPTVFMPIWRGALKLPTDVTTDKNNKVEQQSYTAVSPVASFSSSDTGMVLGDTPETSPNYLIGSESGRTVSTSPISDETVETRVDLDLNVVSITSATRKASQWNAELNQAKVSTMGKFGLRNLGSAQTDAETISTPLFDQITA